MSNFNKGKRVRAIIIAVAITFATNYAITYASSAGGHGPSSTEASFRSGTPGPPATTPKP